MMKTPRYGRLASALLLAALGAACADGGETARNGAPAGLQADGQLPEGHPPIDRSPYSHQDEGEAPGGSRGEVLEVVSASSYTYVRAATDDGEVWLAGPRVELESGQTIAWPEGMAMRDFASNTLDRTFDVIWFVDAIRVVE